MTQYLSEKLKVLSFFLILLVLYIHSGFNTEDFYWNTFIQDLISNKIGRIAVPFFFLISGYLYFLKIKDGVSDIFKKIKKRYYSLFKPYVFACIIFVLTFTAFQLIPFASSNMNWNILPLYDEPFLVIVKNVFWMMDDSNSPIAFHLWFLRDLILIIIFTPVIYFGLKYLRWLFILILFVAASLNLQLYPISIITSLFWFSLGGMLAISESRILLIKSKWAFLIFIIYVLSTYLNESYLEYVNVSLIIVGMIGFWFLYDRFVNENFLLHKQTILSLLTEYTFFIYLFHLPALSIIRKLIILLVGKNSLGYLFSYFLSPILFIIIAISIGILLKKYIPKFYSFSVGGRV
jgi:peptidoglycan/LPS O-acetylase OafA/YrhL